MKSNESRLEQSRRLFVGRFIGNAALRPIYLHCSKMHDMDLLKVQPEAPDLVFWPACV
jgi:hypothetical protein